MLAARRLPGIRVDVAPPAATEALLRMDVAAFAGFASTGPLHVPVLITSVPQYAAVFGRDAPLAWDERRGERVFAHLGSAVRGFFDNGGRRCWVIRLARSAALEAVRQALQPQPALPVALANRFPVSGVLEVAADGSIRAALVQARSEGSWSDELRVATALRQRTIGITGLSVSVADARCTFHARRRIEIGELIEFRDGITRAFAVVEAAVVEAVELAAPYHVTARFCAGFESLDLGSMSPFAPLAGDASSAAFEAPIPAILSSGASDGAPAQIRLTVAVLFVPRIGEWIQFVAGGEIIWLRAEAVTHTTTAGGSPSGALTDADVTLVGTAWRQLDLLPSLIAADRVFCCALDLRVESRNDELARLDDVGLSAGAQRSWWLQRNDEQLYRAALETRADTLAAPEDQSTRFALAPLEAATPPRAWVPLAVDALFGPGIGPVPSEQTALERDGLAYFDASLFLDPELAELATDEVSPRADAIRFLREETRTLFGMHTAFGIGAGGLFGECSLLCVPDAVHIGWRRAIAGPPPAPIADAPVVEPDLGVFRDCTTRVIEVPGGEQHNADSNAVAVSVPEEQWQQIDPDEFASEGEPELLRLHRAMLRLAASNGELFTVLALPRHYRTPQALRYVGRLRTVSSGGVPPGADRFSVAETRTLSYGALYHPWLVSGSRPPPSVALRTDRMEIRIAPPDGMMTGVLSGRASRRGAWVAPANEALRGVVALTPAIEPEDWQSLQDAAVNVVRDDARGFMTLSADTLSPDLDLQAISVRRLLMLLRRMALRRGTTYVFEPNGPVLRRAVQRGFDLLLTDMFRRGAFVGRTEDEAFRVVTDDTVNTRIDADAGRFIVELRVAPSAPMRFLSVLLAQSGERLTVTEEL